MGPIDSLTPEDSGLDKDRLKEIVKRLKVVQRRCAEDPDATGPRNQAKDSLDGLLLYLKGCLVPGAEPLEAVDLDLRLASVEEFFEATGAHSLGQVIGSIRTTLSAPTEDSDPDEEPPPPRRFEPPPTAAVRRRRPRPESHRTATPVKAEEPKGRLGWLKLIVVAAVLGAAAWALYQYRIDARITPSDLPDEVETHEPVASTALDSEGARTASPPSVMEEDFESHEDEMATFTLEIHLAESTLRDGDLSGSLRHFAAAAAIDRRHPRLTTVGRSLIAALLHEADLAHDGGDPNRAGKRVRDARNLARGLQLDDSSIESAAPGQTSTAQIEDFSPRERRALEDAIGHPVRLTLKTRDVIFGHLNGIRDEILLLDVFSGTTGGDFKPSASILASTIRQVRVYDSSRPSEITNGD